MTARDDYPLLTLRYQGDEETVDKRIAQHEQMCDEIDRLRAAVAAMSETLCETGEWIAKDPATMTDDYKKARGVVKGTEPAEVIIRRARGG